MERSEQVKQILEDFVFLDCRLGAHPRIRSVVLRVVGDALESVAHCRYAPEGHFSMPIENSIAGVVVKQRRAYNVSADPGSSELYASFGGRAESQLSVPITAGREVSGVVSFESEGRTVFKRRHVGRAKVLAAIVAHIDSPRGGEQRIGNAQTENLALALRSIRRELGLTQSQLAGRIGASRIAVSRWETGRQPPSFGPLRRWCQGLGLLQENDHALVTSIDITPELLRLLSKDPKFMNQLSPEAFENLIAERLDRMGFDIQKTGNANLRDGGIDLVAIPKIRTVASYLMAVQVKHHSKGAKTGRSSVDRLLSWKSSHFLTGLLVTNTCFTRDAIWTALQERNRDFLRLRDFSDLTRWLEGNLWSPEDWREIPTQIEVAPGIVVEIPSGELRNWAEIWPPAESKGRQVG